jgi:16S rRNA (cytosine967-C5)-methyltransferase
MTPAARLSAAIELIDTIDTQRVPAAKALKEWGTAHRYAGSGDRAAISGLVWDVLRRRASSAWIMDQDTPRARVLGMLRLERISPAIIRNGSTAISHRCSATSASPRPPRWRAVRRSICASTR